LRLAANPDSELLMFAMPFRSHTTGYRLVPDSSSIVPETKPRSLMSWPSTTLYPSLAVGSSTVKVFVYVFRRHTAAAAATTGSNSVAETSPCSLMPEASTAAPGRMASV
jgi:hypothetical protein